MPVVLLSFMCIKSSQTIIVRLFNATPQGLAQNCRKQVVAKNIAIPQNKQFKGGDEIHDNSDLSLTSH